MIREARGFVRPFGVRAAPGGGFYAADLKSGLLTRVGADLAPAWSSPAMRGAHSVAVLPDGDVLVTEFYGRSVRRFRPDGREAPVFAAADPARPWLLAGPAGIEVFPDGTVVVADYGSHALLRFSPAGDLLAWHAGEGWRETGAPPAAASRDGFDRVHAAVILADGRMAVADTWNHRVRLFAPDGSPAGAVPGSFDAPVAIAPLADGFVTSEYGNPRLQRFSLDGRLRGRYAGGEWRRDGAPATKGSAPGFFDRPYDVKLAPGALLVADADNARVQIIPFEEAS